MDVPNIPACVFIGETKYFWVVDDFSVRSVRGANVLIFWLSSAVTVTYKCAKKTEAEDSSRVCCWRLLEVLHGQITQTIIFI